MKASQPFTRAPTAFAGQQHNIKLEHRRLVNRTILLPRSVFAFDQFILVRTSEPLRAGVVGSEAYWEGLRNFYEDNEGFLQGQIGNPKGLDKPNKGYYDPRKWVRESEMTMTARVEESCKDLHNVNS